VDKRLRLQAFDLAIELKTDNTNVLASADRVIR
jgi:hypothetical protein